MQRLFKCGNKIVFKGKNDLAWIEPWGDSVIRFRSSPLLRIEDKNWNLLPPLEDSSTIEIKEKEAYLYNGNLVAKINQAGIVTYFDSRNRRLINEVRDDMPYENGYVPPARAYEPIAGNAYKMFVEFQSDPNEKLYGFGQYANDLLDLKGCTLDLVQLNQQTTIPFFASSNHYGFLWNNPATGRIDTGKNIMRMSADVSTQLDYLIIGGNSIGEIVEKYSDLTGKSPEMPESIAGYWQCKLRYWNQQQVLDVVREYKRRNIPLSVIVIDFFHWTKQGEYKFDPKFWPDPKAMMDELHQMGVKVMVSVWPTVDPKSENYRFMLDSNMLMRAERGLPYLMEFDGPQAFIDPTNPETRKFVWEKCKENYFDLGADMFWLDEAEPEIRPADFDHVRYYLGHGSEVTNLYPYYYSKIFYDGMKECGVKTPVALSRCAWIGSQTLGNVVWSGDIASTFAELRKQIKAGLNMGMAGIPWWTTDIGGFAFMNPSLEKDRELAIRWFQWAAFCPVMRMHGWRFPADPNAVGLPGFGSGGDNEVWSFGDEAYRIFVKYIRMREKMKPYILEQMKVTSETGRPVMRPLFYDFEEDENCFNCDDQYMFGSDLLVAPITEYGCRERKVYFPKDSSWMCIYTGQTYKGGTTAVVKAELDSIPVFCREGAELFGDFASIGQSDDLCDVEQKGCP